MSLLRIAAVAVIGMAAAGTAVYYRTKQEPVLEKKPDESTGSNNYHGITEINSYLIDHGTMVEPEGDTLGATDYPDNILKVSFKKPLSDETIDLKQPNGIVWYFDQHKRLVIVLTGAKPEVWFQRYFDNSDFFCFWSAKGETKTANRLTLLEILTHFKAKQ